MSKLTYQDLCEQYSQYINTCYKRRNLLFNQINQLKTDLAKDLNLLDKVYELDPFDNVPSNKMPTKNPYVGLLNEKDDFIAPHQLETEFDTLGNPNTTFKLALSLEQSENTYPKQIVSAIITAYYISDTSIKFVFPDVKENFEFLVNIENEDNFSPLIQAYKELVLKTYELKK